MIVDRFPVLRALQSRNYRLYLAGQAVSLVGTWMQQVAMSWLVYRVTGSATLLGVIGFASQIPTFILAPVAGVLADRMNRRRLLLVTQGVAMVQAAGLASLYAMHALEKWHVLALTVVLGIVNAFDMPVRQSFVVELVGKREELPNAIALNSSMVNAARLVGPMVAGLVVATAGEGVCFFVNAASYLAVLVALTAIRTEPGMDARRTPRPLMRDLQEGFLYGWNFLPVRALLVLLALTTVAGVPYSVLLPVIARDVIGGGAHTYGYLSAATGVGAVIATIFLASRRTVLGLGRWIVSGTLLFGGGITAFALSGNLALSAVVLAVTGFGSMVQIAATNTILQTIVEEDKRGRTMSFFTMAIMGAAPFGSLIAGFGSDRFGPRATLVAGGLTCVVLGLAFWRWLPHLRTLVRPLYQQLGIIPEVSNALKVAAEMSVPPEKIS